MNVKYFNTLFFPLLLSVGGFAGNEKEISISNSATFFNPTIGQTVSIEINTEKAGNLSAEILDRDGYIVRILVKDRVVKAHAKSVLTWEGKDDKNQIVPDEAYSIHAVVKTATGGACIYFPANQPLRSLHAKIKYYDRQNGILNYQLPTAARVHIQAGWAVKEPKTHKDNGPILKTLANREPRVAGSVIEQWMGYDDSGTIYIPFSAHFMVDIAATALPEKSIITIGNKSVKFVDYALKRSGLSLFTLHPAFAKHHTGLRSYEDVSPKLDCTPLETSWSTSQKAWILNNSRLVLTGKLTGASAKYFAKQPGKLTIFVDESTVETIKSPKSPFRLEVPVKRFTFGDHVLALNWGSDYGPAAVAAFRFHISKNATSKSVTASSYKGTKYAQ